MPFRAILDRFDQFQVSIRRNEPRIDSRPDECNHLLLVWGWVICATAHSHAALPDDINYRPGQRHAILPRTDEGNPMRFDGNGIVQGSGPQFATLVSGADPYCRHCNIPGITQLRTVQWLNPDAFVSTVDPTTGSCFGGDNPAHCQFGNSRRNQFRGPEFVWSDMYLTKRILLREKLALRLEAQFFNVFNHPNFGLPSMMLAGVPGKSSTQTGFGALTYTTSPPTGLLRRGIGRR